MIIASNDAMSTEKIINFYESKMAHFKARIDANQKEIVKSLRNGGCFVQSLAALGSGVPDLLVAIDGKLFLFEVKDGNKCKSAQKLTEKEKEWIDKIKEIGRVEVHVITSISDAEKIIKNI